MSDANETAKEEAIKIPDVLPVLPLKDLVTSAVWLAAFLGRNVVWSGRVLRVSRDGRIVPVGVVEAEGPVFAEEELRAAGS